MKKNAIARIVLYSILILVLAGLLIGGLTLHRNFLPVIHFGDWDHEHHITTSDSVATVPGSGGSSTDSSSTCNSSSGLQIAHSGAVSPLGLTDLEIHWASGTVTIQPGDTDEITFSESENAQEPMTWYVSDDTLYLQFCEDDLRFDYRPGKYHKDLTITVPSDWILSDLTLNGAATKLEMTDMTVFKELEINGASNRCELTRCDVNEVSLSGASNTFSLDGTLNSLDSDGVSVDCTLNLSNHPLEIDMEGVSSQLDVTIPEDCGFTVDCDGLSTKLHTDFAVTGGKNHFSYGDGSCRITIEGVSSDLSIHKAP